MRSNSKVKKEKIIIGIDPGVATGVAIKSLTDNQYIDITTMKIHSALDLVNDYTAPANNYDIYIIIEDARLRKWFGKSGREKLQGAGSIKRDCKIWEDYLLYLTKKGREFNYIMPGPKRGKTKKNAAFVKRLTGWTKRTSKHSRDAVMLIHSITRINKNLFFK